MICFNVINEMYLEIFENKQKEIDQKPVDSSSSGSASTVSPYNSDTN